MNWLYPGYYHVPIPTVKRIMPPPSITMDEIIKTKNNLTKAESNSKPVTYGTPLIEELNQVSGMGYQTFFKKKKGLL